MLPCFAEVIQHAAALRPIWQQLEDFLRTELHRGAVIYPPLESLYTAFNLLPLSEVKVVILGQDPYHRHGQAMGLAFSVPDGYQPLPPSLKNILTEISTDLGLSSRPPQALPSGLTALAREGVLLLNTTLTVEEGKPLSHRGRGWEEITRALITYLARDSAVRVFLLWGGVARSYAPLIRHGGCDDFAPSGISADRAGSHHLILESSHPSPLSAWRGFLGSRPFSQANKFLLAKNLTPVRWQSIFE